MLIKEAGGEFAFINKIMGGQKDQSVIVDNGDDAAVFLVNDQLVAVTTDTIVEGDHFSLEYFTPYQIGIKAIESSASDIVAMGGQPKFIFISLCLPRDTHIEPMQEIYRGMQAACQRNSCFILGGDTTHGAQMIISVTVLGFIDSMQSLCTRSAAKPGDLIYLSGHIGASTAGLKLLRSKIPNYAEIKNFHLEPKDRIDLIQQIAPYANAMIDISDGLSSEVHHICRMSCVGAVIEQEKIPVLDQVKEVAKLFDDPPYLYAYSGGEDFQLLYTIAPENKKYAVGHEIGVITQDLAVLVKVDCVLQKLENRGYDHFRK